MRLKFSDCPSGESASIPPTFHYVTDFKTAGVVMNVFLLDPTARLLSAFVWVSSTNTIGLYALPDWDKPEYVFIDTGIECVREKKKNYGILLTYISGCIVQLVMYSLRAKYCHSLRRERRRLSTLLPSPSSTSFF